MPIKKTRNYMVLQTPTRVGLTFGQIISSLALIGGLITAYVSLNIRITSLEVQVQALEKGRITNANNIEVIRTENRQDHKEIMQKLDKLIEEIR